MSKVQQSTGFPKVCKDPYLLLACPFLKWKKFVNYYWGPPITRNQTAVSTNFESPILVIETLSVRDDPHPKKRRKLAIVRSVIDRFVDHGLGVMMADNLHFHSFEEVQTRVGWGWKALAAAWIGEASLWMSCDVLRISKAFTQ